MNSTRRFVQLGTALVFAMTMVVSSTAYAKPISRTSFQDDMRKLWEDHITWTRLYIVSAVGNLPDKAATTERLLQNQTDIGNAVKPFYGEAAGPARRSAGTSHCGQLILREKPTPRGRPGDRLERDGDEISGFLRRESENWPLDRSRPEIPSHWALTMVKPSPRSKANTRQARAYDKVHTQILTWPTIMSACYPPSVSAEFRT